MGGARVIGLTGGIASGKSTVAAMFRALGAAVVDADDLARRVVEPGTPGLAAVVERFGQGMLDGRGVLDRKRLGELVFSDPTARRSLNAILHPRIAAASREQIAAHAARGESVVLYEAALIVENGLHHGLDGLIVVSVPERVQLARLMERDHLDEAQARARLSAQLPLRDKVKVANYVVDNAGSMEETQARVRALWEQLAGRASGPPPHRTGEQR